MSKPEKDAAQLEVLLELANIMATTWEYTDFQKWVDAKIKQLNRDNQNGAQ